MILTKHSLTQCSPEQKSAVLKEIQDPSGIRNNWMAGYTASGNKNYSGC